MDTRKRAIELELKAGVKSFEAEDVEYLISQVSIARRRIERLERALAIHLDQAPDGRVVEEAHA